MSADGKLSFAWADGHYSFRLALGQIRELQEKTGYGPEAIYRRNLTGDWKVDELREVIRLGLIGGGIKPIDALRLVERYVDARPLLESKLPAQAILAAALVGVPDDPVGKKEGPEEAETEATSTGASPSPASTPPAPSSASRHRRLMN